jgi:hypothetical protein
MHSFNGVIDISPHKLGMSLDFPYFLVSEVIQFTFDGFFEDWTPNHESDTDAQSRARIGKSPDGSPGRVLPAHAHIRAGARSVSNRLERSPDTTSATITRSERGIKPRSGTSMVKAIAVRASSSSVAAKSGMSRGSLYPKTRPFAVAVSARKKRNAPAYR